MKLNILKVMLSNMKANYSIQRNEEPQKIWYYYYFLLLIFS